MPLPLVISATENRALYESHVKSFWETFLEIPLADNPLNVTDKCEGSQNASDPVFYIPPNLGITSTRDCRTSAGNYIFIPVIAVVVLPIPSEIDEPRNISHQRNVAIGDQDGVTSMRLSIKTNDSMIVLNKPELDSFRIRPPSFSIDLPADGLYGADPGRYDVIADGHYVLAGPILPGTYEIKFSGALTCTGTNCFKQERERNFRTNSTVALEVK